MSKKSVILASALQLLADKGVHNTPMSAIAKAAGTGMGTIYNHFPTKEELINELYVDIKEQEKRVYQPFRHDQPIRTQFEQYHTALIDFFIEKSTNFRFMEQLQASPIITDESRSKGALAAAPVYELLNKGKQDRIIKDIDTHELLLFVGGAVLSYLRWYFGQTAPKRSSIKTQQNMLWDAIKE